jgi:N-acetylated-alpha-linked acidic dipeptidase
MPYPTERLVELIAPEHYTLQLKEPAVAEDKDSSDAGQLPTFNAYAADGDVTADLVYVNYGIPEDYEQLAKLGIDVKGRIVIARYGRSWRGIKPKLAWEHGAVGCIIYSDPRDDGFFQGDVYRPARSGRSRGSSAAASWTCRSIPETRSRQGGAQNVAAASWIAPKQRPC